MHKRIIILGCTGSIGSSTLNIVRNFPGKFTIVGLSAHTNEQGLLAVMHEFSVSNAVLSGCKPKSADSRIYSGNESLLHMIASTEADLVVNGISGAHGLLPSVAVLKAGKDLVLANKETVVMAGPLIFKLAVDNECLILPVDSEHSAIQQLVRFRPEKIIDSVILTASGGPFRNTPAEKFSSISPEEAMRHPTWSMGQKISIDSATLANKGLEIIETHMFFNTPTDKINVVIHPQSVIHSMISTTDGCMYAQLSSPDMQIPIINALSYPDISEKVIVPFNPVGMTLTFEEPQVDKFPMLSYAYDALNQEGSYTIAYNAANEVAVESFINRSIPFSAIPELVKRTLDHDWSRKASDFHDVISIDHNIRRTCRELLDTL